MSNVSSLIDTLQVKPVAENCFQGSCLDLPLPRVFGGQVLAQSLNAAERTVDSDRIAHSLHAHFLRPGRPDVPILFSVEQMRDGRSLSCRRVTAKQSGKPILIGTVSFHVPEDGLEHQYCKAEHGFESGQQPEKFPELWTLIEAESETQQKRMTFLKEYVDLRVSPAMANNNPSGWGYWFRFALPESRGRLSNQALLAFISDFGLVSACLRALGLRAGDPRVTEASLDHVVYFHRQPIDDWNYYCQASPVSGMGRGLATGEIYDRSGALLTSVVQESLIRLSQGIGD